MNYGFDDGFVLTEKLLDKTVSVVFETLKNELPEEAQRFDVLKTVLEECKDKLSSKKIYL